MTEPSRLRNALYAYPWALQRPDLETALDHVALSGCDELIVTPCYHRADFFQPADPTMPICYGEYGAVFFGLDESLYTDTPIRPRFSRLANDPDELSRAAEHARGRGIDWSLWMIYNFQDELSEKYPAFARHDPFGQPHRGALSLGAPEVSTYFNALTRDVLTRFEPSVVWIESLYRHGMAMPGKTRAPITPRCQLLLSLDWNPGMLARAEAAGVPAQSLRDDVANWLKAQLPHMPTAEDAAPVDDTWLARAFDGALAAYLDACRKVTTDLWLEMAGLIHGADSRIYHQPVGSSSLGTDLDASVNAQIDRVMLSPTDAATVTAARQGQPESAEIYIQLHGQYDDEASLVADVASAAGAGADGVSFYAYGLLRDEQMRWMANACKAS